MSKRRSIDDKARDYAERLFDVSSKNTKIDELPEDYSPDEEIEAYDAEFNLVKLVSKSTDPQTGLPRNLKIPEGDFPEAKNYFDFCTNYLSTDVKFPFSRQMWIAIHALGEFCPRCSHPRWREVLKVPIRAESRKLDDRVQFLHYGKCPKCGVTKVELLKNKELNLYTEVALCIGQRAGKSTITASLSAYMLHKFLKFPKLSSVCEGIQASTPLTATFLGLRFADAFSLLWEPLTNNIKESVWFTDYHAMLDDYGHRLGTEFYRQTDMFIKYRHKNLELHPAGPNKRVLRGRTRWLAGTDELGWWPLGDKEDRERADGEEVYKALDRSMLTVRQEMRTLFKKGYSNFLMPLNINVSSPADQADMINKLVEKNKESTRCLALRLPTWEVSPMFTRDNEEIVQAYKDDPVAAERDYGANPPLNSAKFIVREDAIRTFSGPNVAKIESARVQLDDEWRKYATVQLVNPPQPCPATLLSIDAGYSKNSFAATFLYLSQIKTGDVLSTTVHVPCIVEIQPSRGERLHYTRIYNHVLKPLMRALNTRFFFADRWNSIALLDRAADEFADVQLVAKQYSVKYADFVLARSTLQESRIVLPRLDMEESKLMQVTEYPAHFIDSPAAHLLFQLLTVKDMGSTVTKGGNYTDDIFRALVLGLSRINDPKIKEQILLLSAKVTRAKMLGAVTAGRSMGMSQRTMSLMAGRKPAALLLGHSSITPTEKTGLDPNVPPQSGVVRVSR